jgi:hypothetical protein
MKKKKAAGNKNLETALYGVGIGDERPVFLQGKRVGGAAADAAAFPNPLTSGAQEPCKAASVVLAG